MTAQKGGAKLERFTKKPWGTYPRCQVVDEGQQCKGTVYSNDMCWNHYLGGIELPSQQSGDQK